jgi:hypothetical protein
MIAALARRDEKNFVYWRDRVEASETDRADLWATTFEVFREAVERRFPTKDRDDIVEFLSRERAMLWDGAELPSREAEAIIRSGLGERGLVSGIDKKLITLIRVQVFLYAIEDLRMSSSDVDSIICLAERYVAEDKATEQRS